MTKLAKNLRRYDIVKIDDTEYIVFSAKTTWQTVVFVQRANDLREVGDRIRFELSPTEPIEVI